MHCFRRINELYFEYFLELSFRGIGVLADAISSYMPCFSQSNIEVATFFAIRMPNAMLKFVLMLGVCTFLLYALLRLTGQSEAVVQHLEATSTITTTERLFPHDVLIDKRTGINDEYHFRDIESQNPSLPIMYWNKHKKENLRKSATCAKYPSIFELEFNNIYWQTVRTSNGTFQLFGAYYDIRKSSPLGPAIRILGMIDRIEPTIETFCQLWFEEQKEATIVKTFEYRFIWHKLWGNYKQGIYQPYLLACQIPKEFYGTVPGSVSIVEKGCDTATNNLRVIYNPAPEKKKKGFAVCVKGLDFLYDDKSARLVEWIEMLKILGADKIYFYDLQMHPNMPKILQHYEQEGLVHLTPLTLAGGQPNMPGFQHLYLEKNRNHKRLNEIIPYNDCLYKNMYMYEFIALLDIDEMIVPKSDMTWAELMQRVLPKSRLVKNGTYPSYNVRNVYFLHENKSLYEDIPQYMLMLQHVNRAHNYSKPGENVKCFHNPELVLSLHNHFPLLCLEERCPSYSVDTEDAHLHHYCGLKKNCEQFRENSVKDTTIWKYKDELVRRSERTLVQLGFYRSP